MDGMKDFPSEFIAPFVISFNYFKRRHIRFFHDGVSFWRTYWRFFITSAILLLHLTSMGLYKFRVLGSKIILDMGFMTASFLTGLQSVLRSTVIVPKKKDIERLIIGMAKMWKTENLTDVQIAFKNRRLKQLNIVMTVLKWGMNIAILENLVHQLIYTVYGKIFKEDADFILPYAYVYPFDPLKNWGRYLLTYFFQCYSMVRLTDYFLGTHTLIIILTSQISTEFALLREDIKNATPMRNRNKLTQEPIVDENRTIEAMVKNHQELIKLAQLLNDIFSRMIFIDLCFFAVVGYFFSVSFMVSHDVVDKIVNICSVIIFLVSILMFCYYSEMLKEESAGIAESAYENPWYEGDTHYQKTIRFMIMRAQRPCYVTSLNYVPISLNTFTKIVSTTWSYFSLAMAVFDDNN